MDAPRPCNDVEVHRFLSALTDKDHDSVHSADGDGSNTDSGRGGSEEGERHARELLQQQQQQHADINSRLGEYIVV